MRVKALPPSSDKISTRIGLSKHFFTAVLSDLLLNFSSWIPKLLLNLALFEHVLHDMVLLESLDQLQSLLDQWIRAVPTHSMTMTRMMTMKMKTTMRTLKNMKQHSKNKIFSSHREKNSKFHNTEIGQKLKFCIT